MSESPLLGVYMNHPQAEGLNLHDLVCLGGMLVYGGMALSTVFKQRECRSPMYLIFMLLLLMFGAFWCVFQVEQRLTGWWVDTVIFSAGFLLWRYARVYIPPAHQAVAVFTWYGEHYPVRLKSGVYMYLPWTFQLQPLHQVLGHGSGGSETLELPTHGEIVAAHQAVGVTSDDYTFTFYFPTMRFDIDNALNWRAECPCIRYSTLQETVLQLLKRSTLSFTWEDLRSSSGRDALAQRWNKAVEKYLRDNQVDLTLRPAETKLGLTGEKFNYAGDAKEVAQATRRQRSTDVEARMDRLEAHVAEGIAYLRQVTSAQRPVKKQKTGAKRRPRERASG